MFNSLGSKCHRCATPEVWTMRYQGVDFWVAVGYLDKVASVSGSVEGEE